MRLYKSPINIPKTGHELVTCHYPLRIDTYSSCYHDCEYCYAKSMLTDRNLWTPDDIRIADIKEIINKFESFLDGRGTSVIAKAIKNRIPARLGGLTDCFQPIEKQKGVTLQLIKYLNSINYPYLIVTKSDLITDHTYLKELRRDLAYVQITVTTLNKKRAKQLEPKAPPPARRIKALKDLNAAGIYCAGRVSPIIPNVTEVDCFALIDALERIEVPHIIFEFFRGNQKMIRRIADSTGINVSPLQKRGVYYRFPLREKEISYGKIADRMKGSKTAFTICSDGDPVPFSINSTVNCCGADKIKKMIPHTKFGMGNQKVASNMYVELMSRKTIEHEDLNYYFSLSDDDFDLNWNNGSFVHYIPNCAWDSEKRIYTIE
jgi:DNA repair photolyase